MRKAQIAEDWDWYIEAIDTYIAENGYNPALAKNKFDALLEGKKDTISAYIWAEEMVKKDWDSLIFTSSTDPQTTFIEEEKKLRQLTSMDKSPPSTQL